MMILLVQCVLTHLALFAATVFGSLKGRTHVTKMAVLLAALTSVEVSGGYLRDNHGNILQTSDHGRTEVEKDFQVPYPMDVPSKISKRGAAAAQQNGEDTSTHRSLRKRAKANPNPKKPKKALHRGDRGKWALCTSSNQCINGCCSNVVSLGGEFKCTPVEGGFRSDLCVSSIGSPTVPRRPNRYGLQPSCFLSDETKFNICLDLGSMNGSYQSWMDSAFAARDRWQEVILVDTFPKKVNSTWLAPLLQRMYGAIATILPPLIDDLYMAITETTIDEENVVGYGGPNYCKNNSTWRILPIAGSLVLDSTYLHDPVASNTLKGLIEHEMGRILGVGTLFARDNLPSGNETDDKYLGANALREWRKIGCSGDIPIDTDGGNGTAGGLWDEACLVGELMTGWIGDGDYVSSLTIGAMMDLGYIVNMSAGVPFTLDQLSRSNCADYCPEATGEAGSSTLQNNSTADEIPDAIFSLAANVLAENRANAPLFVPDGFEYCGGDAIDVFTKASNGRIMVTTVTWNQVEDYFMVA